MHLSRSLEGAERPADYAQVPSDAILSNGNNSGVIRELYSLHIRAYMQKNSIVIITPGLRITTFIYNISKSRIIYEGGFSNTCSGLCGEKIADPRLGHYIKRLESEKVWTCYTPTIRKYAGITLIIFDLKGTFKCAFFQTLGNVTW